MSTRRGPCIGLHGPNGTLVRFWPLDPRPEDIHIASIAKSLGCEPRFCGQTESPWQVALHSVEASYVPNEDGSEPTPEEQFERLGHDASEGTGLRDFPAPYRRHPDMGMGTYEEAHELVMSAYAAKYNMAPLFWKKPHVKHADAMLYRTEARDFRQPGTWHDPTLTGPTLPYRLQASTPQEAECRFLERFIELCVATGRIEAANEGMLALEQISPSAVPVETHVEAAVNLGFQLLANWLLEPAIPRVSKTDNFGV